MDQRSKAEEQKQKEAEQEEKENMEKENIINEVEEKVNDEEVVIEPSELDHVEILRKKREAQRKLNSEIPSSIKDDHKEIKDKLKEKLEKEDDIVEEEKEDDKPISNDLIEKFENPKHVIRLNIINEYFISKEDLIALVDKEIENVDLTENPEKQRVCIKLLDEYKINRENALDMINSDLNDLATKSEKEINEYLRGLESFVSDMNHAGDEVIKIFIDSMKEKSAFVKICTKKVQTKIGSIFIAAEILILALAFLLLYLFL